MRLLRPDPRTGIIGVGQKISRPTVIPLVRELQATIYLTEDINVVQTIFIEPVMVIVNTEIEQDSSLTQQIEVTSPPKSKKNRRRSNKKLASKT